MGDSSCSSPELLATIRNGDVKSKEVESSRSLSAGKGDKVLTGQKYSRMKEISELHNLDMKCDNSTPGYMSDESRTQSMIPPVGGRRKLQNNIAFWEQLQHSGK
jgi:hypothetical protein